MPADGLELFVGTVTLTTGRNRGLSRKEVTMDERQHPQRILLVDDEEAITAQLAPFLERAGFTVAAASDGEEALRRVQDFDPDLIVLDVLMPRLDGRETLRCLRQAGDWTPVILLTQVGSPTERAMALDEGADDYLNKPFEPYELAARIRAVLRRARRGTPSLAGAHRLRSGPLELDRRSRRVLLQGREVSLTSRAVALLEYLMLHPDEVLSRERLLDAVWGWDFAVAIRAVDSRVAELRRVLGDDAENPRFIETVIGEGYRFVGSVAGGE
jgi:DNA-binding response OmpR family regulator